MLFMIYNLTANRTLIKQAPERQIFKKSEFYANLSPRLDFNRKI